MTKQLKHVIGSGRGTAPLLTSPLSYFLNPPLLSTSTSISYLFCDFLFNNKLSHLVKEPTHIKGNILDVVLTNSDNNISNISVSPQLYPMNSDFFIVTFDYICPNSPTAPYSHQNTFLKQTTKVSVLFLWMLISVIVFNYSTGSIYIVTYQNSDITIPIYTLFHYFLQHPFLHLV